MHSTKEELQQFCRRILQHFLLGTSQKLELSKRLSAYIVMFLACTLLCSQMQCVMSKLDIFSGFGSPTSYLHAPFMFLKISFGYSLQSSQTQSYWVKRQNYSCIFNFLLPRNRLTILEVTCTLLFDVIPSEVSRNVLEGIFLAYCNAIWQKHVFSLMRSQLIYLCLC